MAVEKVKKNITDVRHPFYTANSRNWRKWRLTYEGGDRFIWAYLKQFSKREDNQEFRERKAITYCPAFAKAAINEVKNSIFQRTSDVSRQGGSDTYQAAVQGLENGVDLLGSTMNAFMGRRVLPELLSMSRVGIFVDMPQLTGITLKDIQGKRPYLYWYPAEDILSWCDDETDSPNEFSEVLLCDTTMQMTEEEEFGLPYDTRRRYRHIWKQYNEDGSYDGIYIQFYDNDSSCCDKDGDKNYDGPIKLDIPRIPFVIMEISDSLLMDVANYQIALLNLSSSDLSYILKSNFPFYVEQFDPRTTSQHLKQEAPNVIKTSTTSNVLDPTTQNYAVQTTHDRVHEVKVGVASGRRYPMGVNQPAFIHPSSEPLTASMAKQEQMKQEIRQLVALAITNLMPKAGSPASSDKGQSTLEAGLSYIGLELEHAERQIAIFWAAYEGKNTKPATVKYPENYSLKSDQDRRDEAQALETLMSKVPSKTFQKKIAISIAQTLLSGKISSEDMALIEEEINAAVVVTTDPDIIKSDFESGFVGLDTASKIRGYPAGEAEKAKVDHAERAARIAIAQSKGGGAGAIAKTEGDPASRGVKDQSVDPQAPSQEKTNSRDTTIDHTVTSKVRGEGK